MPMPLFAARDSLDHFSSREFPHRAPAEPDAQIVARARANLDGSPHRELRAVRCDVAGGALLLRGRVRSYYMKQLAQESIRHLAGMHRIINQIEVDS